MRSFIKENWPVIIISGTVFTVLVMKGINSLYTVSAVTSSSAYDSSWKSPSLFTDRTLEGKDRELVIYGEKLIAHTSFYLGPRGKVASISNGMNCQNCHLNAGKKPGVIIMEQWHPPIPVFEIAAVPLKQFISA